MNQHVDRRAILASSAAATAALATAAAASRLAPAEETNDAEWQGHPDAELFRLDKELDVAHARLKKIERSQARKSKKAEKDAGPRPLHPMDWKAPQMPEDLSEMNRAALDKATVADVKDGKWPRPAPVEAWQEKVDQQRVLVKAEWDAYRERHDEQLRFLGYDAGEKEFEAACAEEWERGMRIFAVPAYTIDGMMVKLRAGERLRLQDYANANDAHASVAEDVRRLANREPPAETAGESDEDFSVLAAGEWEPLSGDLYRELAGGLPTNEEWHNCLITIRLAASSLRQSKPELIETVAAMDKGKSRRADR
ncbi:hypothetical protein LB523_10510 [Mesorhizobium sp. ESP-6-4]|uniref:hypothetical protein n=1 Tax=Mesorhizobium sp. ESP-6-4 TaxID=2876624 RepID=UPI001CCA3886|nr:hypothetical protein [Mesorhizobium sp. ESP-6-4]MBZ9659477.1 hypothetical protein [Mesorhizobium sp. ESP-6-4]